MMLSGNRIKREVNAGRIVIDPFDPKRINPNSYNVRLHEDLYYYDRSNASGRVLDMAKEMPMHRITIHPKAGYVLEPGRLYLGRTIEYTETPFHAPMLEGRSSCGRLGLSIHSTAGVGDRFFKGHWTCELSVVEPLRIYAGVEVAQLMYHELDDNGPVYAGKYVTTRDQPPKASGLWKEVQQMLQNQKL